MIYFLFDAFRYQFIIFLEHTLGIQYVLHCAEYREPFWKQIFTLTVPIRVENCGPVLPSQTHARTRTIGAAPAGAPV